MHFESFGYRGSFAFKPPLKVSTSDGSLSLLATPYGSSNDLENALSEFINVFESMLSDPDATNPYPKLTCFNTQENLIYTSLQFLNDYIYSNYNKNILSLGCDLACIYKHQNSIYFCQVGWPLSLIYQGSQTLPFSSSYSFRPKQLNKTTCLPSNLLGLESSTNLKVHHLNLQQKNELLLLKSNECPDSLISLYPSPLEKIAEAFASSNPEQGFWLGKFSF